MPMEAQEVQTHGSPFELQAQGFTVGSTIREGREMEEQAVQVARFVDWWVGFAVRVLQFRQEGRRQRSHILTKSVTH